jgi:hypothetical protein
MEEEEGEGGVCVCVGHAYICTYVCHVYVNVLCVCMRGCPWKRRGAKEVCMCVSYAHICTYVCYVHACKAVRVGGGRERRRVCVCE